MNKEQFYAKYANTPLAKRFIPFNITKYGLMNLHTVHKRISEIDEIIRPYQVTIDELLSRAGWFYLATKKEGK